MTDTPSDTPTQNRELVARAGSYYRWTRFLMCAMLIFGGAWFLYDGFIGYPEHNARIDRIEAERTAAEHAGDTAKASALTGERMKLGDKKNDAAIVIQKLLGYSLPPLGLALLIWTLYNSRGALRLGADDILHAPGHPPVPLTSITRLDMRLWDRKGIAYVDYDLPGTGAGKIRLDDFVYQRPPTDAIFDRIKAAILPEESQETV